jgi:hypothetical protein
VQVLCSFGNLAPGASATVIIEAFVAPTTQGTLVNTAAAWNTYTTFLQDSVIAVAVTKRDASASCPWGVLLGTRRSGVGAIYGCFMEGCQSEKSTLKPCLDSQRPQSSQVCYHPLELLKSKRRDRKGHVKP